MNQIKDNLDHLAAKNTNVLLIYYEDRKHALQWIEQQNCPFDMLLDKQRLVYHYFGLGRETTHSMGSLFAHEFFIRIKARTGRFENIHIPAHHDIPREIDMYQKAGNFLLDTQGNLRWLYKAPAATVRPSMEDILKEVTKLAQG